ncbi:hypothetical protein F4782DRAFT_478564 [Xylaria castorea]|nr:hypothetical protein F4782DRAFT_478564 [Xylaria castorea]
MMERRRHSLISSRFLSRRIRIVIFRLSYNGSGWLVSCGSELGGGLETKVVRAEFLSASSVSRGMFLGFFFLVLLAYLDPTPRP